MSTLDRLSDEKKGKKAKKKGGMASAVASTESIRNWVRFTQLTNLDGAYDHNRRFGKIT